MSSTDSNKTEIELSVLTIDPTALNVNKNDLNDPVVTLTFEIFEKVDWLVLNET